MKRILFLGAAAFQLPPIFYALEKGYYVITTDNNPANPGHKLADENYSISTTDKEGVLRLANSCEVDGILAFGSDVSSRTAAFVSEKLGLPGNPYNTVELLSNKARFRNFLKKEGLQSQIFQPFSSWEKSKIKDFVKTCTLPLVIKPVDASGSKGVSILANLDGLDRKVKLAFQASHSNAVIVEEWIEKKGMQICGDAFFQHGEMVNVNFGDGYFYPDVKFLAPYGESFPCSHSTVQLEKVKSKLEAVLKQSGFRQGAVNFDVWLDKNNEVFINEIGPRSGGNFIPSVITMISGKDVIGAAVEAALDASFNFNKMHTEPKCIYASSYMIHSSESGILKSVVIHEELKKFILHEHPYLKPGEIIYPFSQANFAIGNLIMGFESKEEMVGIMSRINDLITIELVEY